MANSSNRVYLFLMNFSQSPSYALFGQAPEIGLAASFHVERVSSRIALHNGIVEPHRHPHLHQLTCWISGSGQYMMEDQRQQISPGMVCWVPAGRTHGFSVDAGSDAIVISLAREHVDKHLASFERGRGEQVILNPGVILSGLECTDDIARLFEMAERDYMASGWAYQESIGAIASLIFIFVGRHLAERDNVKIDSTVKAPLFYKLQACVEQRFLEHPSVAQLAAEIGTTPYLLNKACQAATGLNVSNFVRRRIVREVERLLLFTVSDMAQIAELTGFSDPSHFTRTFKSFHGKTPRGWRARTIDARTA
jgi:AraC family transcriptional regulator, transcriptional activator of pobA